VKKMAHGRGHRQHLQNETVKNRAMSIPPKKKPYSKKNVRLPDDLWARAELEADRNGRTLNAELTARLLEAYAQPTLADLGQKQDEMGQLVRQLLNEIETLRIRK
jgi:hypothetical protein